MGIYTRKYRDITCKNSGTGEWGLIGGNVGVGYLPPHLYQHKVKARIEKMIWETDTIWGDFKCY